jgi:hypothetical protein
MCVWRTSWFVMSNTSGMGWAMASWRRFWRITAIWEAFPWWTILVCAQLSLFLYNQNIVGRYVAVGYIHYPLQATLPLFIIHFPFSCSSSYFLISPFVIRVLTFLAAQFETFLFSVYFPFQWPDWFMAPYFIFVLSTGSMILLGSIQRLELIKLIERHIGRERRLQVAARWQKEAQERSEKLRESLRKLCTKDDMIGRGHKTWGKIWNTYKILVEMSYVRRLDGRFRQTCDCILEK